jgi:hypothetical protein
MSGENKMEDNNPTPVHANFMYAHLCQAATIPNANNDIACYFLVKYT